MEFLRQSFQPFFFPVTDIFLIVCENETYPERQTLGSDFGFSVIQFENKYH